jgi:hypothetical protein
VKNKKARDGGLPCFEFERASASRVSRVALDITSQVVSVTASDGTMEAEHRVVRGGREVNTAGSERRGVLAGRRRILADIHEPLPRAVGVIDASEHREVVAVGEDDITACVLNREHGRGREGCLLLDEQAGLPVGRLGHRMVFSRVVNS